MDMLKIHLKGNRRAGDNKVYENQVHINVSGGTDLITEVPT